MTVKDQNIIEMRSVDNLMGRKLKNYMQGMVRFCSFNKTSNYILT